MKWLKYFFASFFLQHFWAVALCVIAVLMYLIAHIVAIAKFGQPFELLRESKEGVMFFLALLFAAAASGSHIKSLMAGDSTSLLPKYRGRIVTGSILIWIIFLIWPTIFLGLRGLPVLPVFAMIICALASVLWIAWWSRESIFAIIVAAWLLRIVYEFLGLHSDEQAFLFGTDIAANIGHGFAAAIIITLSIIALSWYLHKLLTIPVSHIPNADERIADPYAREYDREDALSKPVIKRKIRSVHSWRRNRWSDLQMARRLQIRLFTPGFGTAMTQTFIVGGMFLWFFTITNIIDDSDGPTFAEIIPYAYILYMLAAIMIATDFLQHRSHLPAIWLGSKVHSRPHFTRVTLLCYIGVMLKNFFAITLPILPAYFIMRAGTVADFLAVLASGFVMTMFILVLSILSSEIVESPSCKGWTFSTIIVFLLVLGIAALSGVKAMHTPMFWIIASSLTGVTVILSLLAFRKWTGTEMDFKSPDMGM